MNKKIFYIISFIVGTLLFLNFGCKTSTTITSNAELIQIDTSISSEVLAQQMIRPYKESLDSEMNEVLVISAMEFPKEKSKPETLLGNLVADLSLKIISEKFPESKVDFCLLNNGGLRKSLPKGEITRGKIFELMPFDNELVIVTINKDSLKTLLHYLNNIGGQPISGNISLHFSGKEIILEENLFPNEIVRIITSDYLAQGGDNMSFFLNPVKYETTGIKLRDAIIEFSINEHQKGNQLTSKLDGRIRFK